MAVFKKKKKKIFESCLLCWVVLYHHHIVVKRLLVPLLPPGNSQLGICRRGASCLPKYKVEEFDKMSTKNSHSGELTTAAKNTYLSSLVLNSRKI